MDTNNWRPSGEPAMDGGDWRSQLPLESRQRIANKILDILVRFLPVKEELQELKRIAVRFEEKVYTTARSKPHYLGKISQKMLIMMTKTSPMPNNMQSNSANYGPKPRDPAHRENANCGDWQEEVYLKIKCMKDAYLQDLNEIFCEIATELHKEESLRQPQPHSQERDWKLEEIRSFMNMLEHFISLLQVAKSNVPKPGYEYDQLDYYEDSIIEIIKCSRPHEPLKPMPSLQQGQALPPHHIHSMQQFQQPQSQVSQVQPHENQMNSHIHNPSLRVKHEVKQEPGTLDNPSPGVEIEVKEEQATLSNPSLGVKNEVKKEPGTPKY